ncbi:hypothetical protein F4553_001242 [Allocatelliglobosispora scoriae]|uniref:DUF3040 domain-containing protein n=1 Tax=Allocatelliglobosispora scoriae TaxID=643052 RepID=A0A841BLL1_9ACTN|nr:DUF3040 domain-containing protein [Allocatelliglobosispora scoriae]MBB5867863.1 hypothetical protein [Allocatelliglobosispora scoriae]
MLGHDEQRRLDEIELCIVSDDPRFARRMRRLAARGHQPSTGFWWWWLLAMGVAGGLSALFHTPVILLAAVVMSTGVVMARWLPSRLR